MLKITVQSVFGSGGMVGPNGNRHQYWSGKAVAFSPSVKKGIRRATILSERICGEGASWMLCFYSVRVENAQTGQVIYEN